MATLFSPIMDQQSTQLADSAGQKRKLDDLPSPGAGSNLLSATEDKPDMDLEFPEGSYDLNQSIESMPISETKRRAQNRAAQRAFRERKERHLRDLETRLAELESESRSWKSTNMALRSQLSLLEEQLHHYRNPQTGYPASNRPQNTQAYSQSQDQQLPYNDTGHPRDNLPAHMVDPFSTYQQQQPQQQQPLTQRGIPGEISPGSTSLPGLSYDSPSSGSGSGSSSSRVDEFCEKLSTACVVHPKSQNIPQIAADSPNTQSGNLFTSNEYAGWPLKSNKASPSAQTVKPSPPALKQELPSHYSGDQAQLDIASPLNLDFGNVATGFGTFDLGGVIGGNMFGEGNGNGDINNLLSNDFGVFDPLDDILGWNPASKDSVPASASTDASTAQTDLNLNIPGSLSELSSGSSSSAYNATSPHTPSSIKQSDEQVPVSSHKFIPCADVWDRICSHPRFGEIDINSMCQELRNKARCSKTGVVLDEQDVDQVLKSMK